MYETKSHYSHTKFKADKHDTSTMFDTGLSLAPSFFSVLSLQLVRGGGLCDHVAQEPPGHLKTKTWSQKARKLAENDQCLMSSLEKDDKFMINS